MERGTIPVRFLGPFRRGVFYCVLAFSIAFQTAALLIFTDYATSTLADSDVNHASTRFVESSNTLHIAFHSLRGVPGNTAFLASFFLLDDIGI